VTGGKLIRAQPVAAAAENGLIKLVRGRRSEELLDELTAFPHGAHDDCVDALSGAHTLLVRRGSGRMTTHVPKGRIPLASDAYRVGSHGLGSPLGLPRPSDATRYRGRLR
ncbi:MAG: hypothetical protein M3O76_02905, partial [Actinomycetota bacterium]|nr:hypothetical protein [Actinomycetota bacterium]